MLADAERIEITMTLQLTLYLKKEREYAPWKIAAGWFRKLLKAFTSAEKFATKVKVRACRVSFAWFDLNCGTRTHSQCQADLHVFSPPRYLLENHAYLKIPEAFSPISPARYV